MLLYEGRWFVCVFLIRVHQQRPDSPAPSGVSMKSDSSMIEPVTFKDEFHSQKDR